MINIDHPNRAKFKIPHSIVESCVSESLAEIPEKLVFDKAFSDFTPSTTLLTKLIITTTTRYQIKISFEITKPGNRSLPDGRDDTVTYHRYHKMAGVMINPDS